MLTFLCFLSMFCISFGITPLDGVSINLGSMVRSSIDEQDSQSVIVRTYEAENDRWLYWSNILSSEWNPGTLENARVVLEKRHIVFWLKKGNDPLPERFSLALELPYQERSLASYKRGEIYQAEPVVLQITGYSNIVEFVSSLSKAKTKMDQWMEVAFEKEITNLAKRIPNISFSLSSITDANSRGSDYYVDDKIGVCLDPGFSSISYHPLTGFNVHDAFFYTMIINAKPYRSDNYSERKNKFKPFLVMSTEKKYLRFVANYLDDVKGKSIEKFGAIEKQREQRALVESMGLNSWIELDDGTCVLPEFTTKRIMADTTVLVPKALMSYNDVVKLIPLLNPNSAARELQQLRQQHSKNNSIRKKSNDLFH